MESNDTVSCPHCGRAFELSAAMHGLIERHVSQERARIRDAAEATARTEYEARIARELEGKEAELVAVRAQVAENAKRETELARRARELEEREQQAQLEVERTLTAERAKIREQAEANARARYEAQPSPISGGKPLKKRERVPPPHRCERLRASRICGWFTSSSRGVRLSG